VAELNVFIKRFRASYSLLKFATTFSGLKPPNKNDCSFVVFNPEKVGGKNTTKNSGLKLRNFRQ